MYSRQEAAQLKQEFWTVFGQYMSPVLSAEGEKVNWVNYKTGEKDIYFRMQADNKSASIAIELAHKDKEIQQIYFEQFQQFRNLFVEVAGEGWSWHLHTYDLYGKVISKIEKSIQQVSVFNKEDWPKLISFFKPNIVALDEFWSHVKYGFEALR